MSFSLSPGRVKSCRCLPRFCADLLLYLWSIIVGDICRTVPQDCFVDVIATGNSQPEDDRKGIDFKVHVQIPWNAPVAFVTLDSPGVFELDTTHVPDALGLRTRYPNAAPVNVLLGRAKGSVQVLMPEAKGTDRRFHDVTLLTWLRRTGLLYPCETCVSDDANGQFRWFPVCRGNRRTMSDAS